MDSQAIALHDAALEPQQTRANDALPCAETPRLRGGRPFSAENARFYAEKAHEARRLRAGRDERAEQRAQIAALDEQPAYDKLRLIRVRKQLDELDKQIAIAIKSGESKVLKELADAQAKLADQERILDGRPLPGSHRPTKPKPTKADAGAYGPVE